MTALSAPRPAGTPLLARVLGNELAKGLVFTRRRAGLLATAVVELAFSYLALRFLVGGGRITDASVAATLPAVLAQFVAATTALQGSAGIAEEVNGGTLEQAMLGPARPAFPVFGRLGVLVVEGLAGAVVLGIAFPLIFGIHYAWPVAALLPAALIVLDALGYAALIIALTLAVASIGSVTHVFNMAIMFFNGMMVPIAVFPSGIQIVAKVVPTTLGVQALDARLLGNPGGWHDATLVWLAVHIVVLFVLAWATYRYTIRRARRAGGLSPR